jgi:hypothetical protein
MAAGICPGATPDATTTQRFKTYYTTLSLSAQLISYTLPADLVKAVVEDVYPASLKFGRQYEIIYSCDTSKWGSGHWSRLGVVCMSVSATAANYASCCGWGSKLQ